MSVGIRTPATLIRSPRLELAARPAALVQDEAARLRLALARTPAFHDLDSAVVDEIAAKVSLRRAPGGSTFVEDEDDAGGLAVVLSGRAKLVIAGNTGREVTVGLLQPGNVFGAAGLLGVSAGRAPAVVALEPITVAVLPRADALVLLAAHPEAALALVGELTRRLRHAEENTAEMALFDVEERLVRRLLALARDDQTELPEGLVIRRRPTQQDLANLVGACRETVSRVFNALVRRGLIAPRGRTLLLSRRLVGAPAVAPVAALP